MSDLESGKERVQKLCDLLKKETLDPAKCEAEKILQEAQEKREVILKEARAEAEAMLNEARVKLSDERKVFDSSLSLAGKQTMLALKQEIESKLFDQEIVRSVQTASSDTSVIAKLIEAIVCAIEKEGIDSDLLATIPQSISKEEVMKGLSNSVIEKLKKESVQLADFTGGAKVKIVKDHLTLDMSSDAIVRLVSEFISEELKVVLFA